VLRLVLALLWLASGLIGLFLPSAAFLPLVADSGLPDALWIALARLGGVAGPRAGRAPPAELAAAA
jgi:hypothetical protein